MFTGIITDIGEVTAVEDGRITIACGYDAAGIAVGASIACDGCCLTATDIVPREEGGCRFSVDASNETRARTTLGDWQAGHKVNLERSLTLQSELGGHMVTGHVDGLATIRDRRPDGESVRFDVACPESLAHLIAEKGSVALDGTSLTVNSIDGALFSVMIVPHTLAVTTWGAKQKGEDLNLEVDVLARYVARISEARL